jgi:hypothetical protein
VAGTDSDNEGAPPIAVGQSRTVPSDIVRELIAAFEEMVENGESTSTKNNASAADKGTGWQKDSTCMIARLHKI